MQLPLILALAAAALAIGYGALLIRWVLSKPAGDEKMQSIAAAIQEGAKAYLTRQTRTMAYVAAVLVLVIGLSPLGWISAAGFLVGAVFSAIAGFIGMMISVKANVRTAVDALSRERTGDTHNPDAEDGAVPASSDNSNEAKEERKDAPF